jgi:hypothetical protein
MHVAGFMLARTISDDAEEVTHGRRTDAGAERGFE